MQNELSPIEIRGVVIAAATGLSLAVFGFYSFFKKNRGTSVKREILEDQVKGQPTQQVTESQWNQAIHDAIGQPGQNNRGKVVSIGNLEIDGGNYSARDPYGMDDVS